jgi:formylglycine-generating enzyme required for sulfatase activity/tRNA A-37 threonylcarbamoyl transferase component Bud32
MPLLPEEILNKRYRIVSLLGKGQYGAVYRGWDVKDKREVAIKEYLDPSTETQRRFRAEARRLSALKHPQLPAVLDHFSLEKSGQYLISEYIDGVSLRQLLDQYGPLPSDLLTGWLQEICVPLTYLHEKGQLHLNIKPANIRVRPSGEVFLVDTGLPGLGIARREGGFAANEQQAQKGADLLTDIYGLGATLYALLTDKTPPDALHRESGLETLVPAREVNPDVEPYLSVAASRAMDLRPEVRFETAADFGRALERPSGRPPVQLSGQRRTEPIRPVGPMAQPPPPRRRIEGRTVLGLAGLLILVVGVGLGVLLADRTRSQEAETDEVAATATFQSQIIAAITAVTTLTPTSAPSPTVIPTPEPMIDDKTGARMIFIPAGPFRMGFDDGEPNEAPSHILRLDAYFIDETEVTNGAYELCVDDGVCVPPDRPGATFHPAYFGSAEYADYPVISVNWFAGRTFCNWRGMRLPTEAEWEKAAGFDPVEGVKHTYPWGNEFDGTLLNYCDANCFQDDGDFEGDDGHRDTAEAGSFPSGASPLGVLDMSGNVMEWVGDWYDRRYYEESAEVNPIGPLEGEFRVIRGGSWLATAEEVQVTYRMNYDPNVSRANLGFRCAMTAQ